jgi:hypothetical protein
MKIIETMQLLEKIAGDKCTLKYNFCSRPDRYAGQEPQGGGPTCSHHSSLF